MGADGILELGDLELELGGVIPAARLAYRTHGTLAPRRDNAILFAHMYSGTPASLDHWIAGGRALDPTRWFIICPGQLGNGESSSPSTTAGRFPELTIGDDVTAQHRLVAERLGIERLALVLGFSMGAQQAYEWAVRFPERVRRVAVFAGLARTTPANDLLVAAAAEALAAGGTKQHAHFWAATALSAELFRREAWRDAGYQSVADLVTRLFEEDFAGRDPADLLAQLAKWRRADVARHTDGDLAAALDRITARVAITAFSHDNVFPVADCRAEQELIAGSSLRVVQSVWGHYAWGMTEAATTQIEQIVADLLPT
ncbi:MAG: alpha/beta fold hydrolase [Solirubrobacterales bacterium]|nr:alpha/beta fold hydrolase [Solirubrobacterales bacterium]MBV9166422.1 alpha/beta fold hydrolase [Solirubrobacterales bacterium]MBV9534789.1 alpha/beta fold hydrolase [Solirubrobacterales bacterium]